MATGTSERHGLAMGIGVTAGVVAGAIRAGGEPSAMSTDPPSSLSMGRSAHSASRSLIGSVCWIRAAVPPLPRLHSR